MRTRNKKLEVSVIVPTYNRAGLLDYTLQSLLQQSLNAERYEVIIADDGSSDDTWEVARKYGSVLQLKHEFQEDRGYRPASARNMGIRAAEGSICVLIDSGIIAREDCLEKHMEFHKEKGASVAAVGYIYGLNDQECTIERLSAVFDPLRPAHMLEAIRSEEIYSDVRERHYQLHNDQIHQLPAPWFFFWSGHVSVSKENLISVGMFDEGYDGKWGIEDNDLGFRLHEAGIWIHLLRSAQCVHFPHHSHKPEKEAEGRQNCLYFHNKFKTPETELFLKYCGATDFVDINLMLMQAAQDT